MGVTVSSEGFRVMAFSESLVTTLQVVVELGLRGSVASCSEGEKQDPKRPERPRPRKKASRMPTHFVLA